jgi:Tol biopolymer transport system component
MRYSSFLAISFIAFSPDGKWICFHGTLPDGSYEIALVDAQGEAKGFKVLLPSKDIPDVKDFQTYFSWSRGGKSIALSMTMGSDSDMQIYILDVDGKKPPQRLAEQDSKKRNWTPAWSPDGKAIVFAVQN